MYGIGYEFDSIQVSFFSDAELFTLAIYVFGNDYVAANNAVAEYVKSTGFSVPSLLDGHLYFAEEVTDDVGYTYFQVACLDDGTPAVDALDAAYLDVVTQDGSWVWFMMKNIHMKLPVISMILVMRIMALRFNSIHMKVSLS